MFPCVESCASNFSVSLTGYLDTSGSRLDLCACLHRSRSGHHARVPAEEIWRAEDTNLHVCAVPHTLYVHQDIGMYPTEQHPCVYGRRRSCWYPAGLLKDNSDVLERTSSAIRNSSGVLVCCFAQVNTCIDHGDLS